jgi:hypothetical protein
MHSPPTSKICARCYGVISFSAPLRGDELVDALVASWWRYVEPIGWVCKGCRIVAALEEAGEIKRTPPGLLAREIKYVD